MPNCYDCGKEQPILKSITAVRPDKKGKPVRASYALCDECFEKSAEAVKK